MTNLSDMEKLARQYLEHLSNEQETGFRERRFMDDEKKQNAEYHAVQTGLYRQWIKRDEWGNGSFSIRNDWPDGWSRPKTDTPEYEELSRLVLRAQLQFHIIMHDRFVGAPEASPTDVLFTKIETKPQKGTPAPNLPQRRPPGRPPLAWEALGERLGQMDLSKIKIGARGWRTDICTELWSRYTAEFPTKKVPSVATLRDGLKSELDAIEAAKRQPPTR